MANTHPLQSPYYPSSLGRSISSVLLLCSSTMGRGKSWDSAENEAIAREWIMASEDPITGANQTSKRFMEAIHRRFIDKGPANPPDGRYGNRTPASCKAHFDNVSTDAQKFYVSLRKVRASSPTGVTEDNILSMAVAVHVGKTNLMDYNYKDFDREQWNNFKAWKVLSSKPKWSQPFAIEARRIEEGTTGARNSGSRSSEERQDGVTIVEGERNPGTRQTTGSRSTASRGEERFAVGGRNAKLIRQEEMRTQAVRALAESAKRKSTALEERNAIAVFSRPEAANLPESDEFFRVLRNTYLARARKRARETNEHLVPSRRVTESQVSGAHHSTANHGPGTAPGPI